MPFVKNVKTGFFCGTPPCPLCFDWVDDPKPSPDKYVLRETLTKELEKQIVSGFVKMTEDLTGKSFNEATKEEKAQVKKIGEGMHNNALIGKVLNNEPPPVADTTPQDAKWFNDQITAKRKNMESERAYKEKMNKPRNLDDMGWGEEQRKAEQEATLKESAEAERKKELDQRIDAAIKKLSNR